MAIHGRASALHLVDRCAHARDDDREAQMRIHAIQTGRVRIKRSQIADRGHGLARRVAPLMDAQWSAWLPTHAYAIEHRDGVILVDTGASAGLKRLPRWHSYFRLAVRFDVEPDEEAGPQLRAIGITPADVRRVVLTHMHIDHDAGLGAVSDERGSGQSGRARGRLWARGAAARLSPGPLAEKLRAQAARPRQRRLRAFRPLAPADRRRRDRRGRDAGPHARSSFGHRRRRRRGGLHRRRRLVQRSDDTQRNDRRRRRGRERCVGDARRHPRLRGSRPTIYLPAHDPEAALRLAERRTTNAAEGQSITACAAGSRDGAGAALGERISASSGKAESETSVISRKSFE